MKTLLLLRHAKSSWKEAGLADQDRPLKKRGRRDAPRMGRWLREQDLEPDLIVSSTAVRARETAELVAEQCGYRGGIELNRRLYEAGPASYLRAVQAVSDGHSRVLLVGHNPAFEELLEMLTGQNEPLPTAGLAQIDFDIGSWQELHAGTRGVLVHLWRPRELP